MGCGWVYVGEMCIFCEIRAKLPKGKMKSGDTLGE